MLRRGDGSAFGRGNLEFPLPEPCESWALVGFGWAFDWGWKGALVAMGSVLQDQPSPAPGLWGVKSRATCENCLHHCDRIAWCDLGGPCVPEKYRAQVSNFASPFN